MTVPHHENLDIRTDWRRIAIAGIAATIIGNVIAVTGLRRAARATAAGGDGHTEPKRGKKTRQAQRFLSRNIRITHLMPALKQPCVIHYGFEFRRSSNKDYIGQARYFSAQLWQCACSFQRKNRTIAEYAAESSANTAYRGSTSKRAAGKRSKMAAPCNRAAISNRIKMIMQPCSRYSHPHAQTAPAARQS
ncbi:hypothetical protein V8J88_01520 [Massilia sp. W12]|uniref:hypothetical protein n=1 Tax=Massilia sp. W12 TaxID=3126507 RepID=UPI0030D53D61